FLGRGDFGARKRQRRQSGAPEHLVFHGSDPWAGARLVAHHRQAMLGRAHNSEMTDVKLSVSYLKQATMKAEKDDPEGST
ncbi:MAG: hypothetical protein ACREVL_03405, partial [Solimonas sp.]